MRYFIYSISGLLFGIGLIQADMTNTLRVKGFFDLFGGAWDPTLAFVMIGAMIPMAIAWMIVKKKTAPLLGGSFPAPASKIIDRKLIWGAIFFGIGWGIAGLCPAPAITAILMQPSSILVFVLFMVFGMYIQKWLSEVATR